MKSALRWAGCSAAIVVAGCAPRGTTVDPHAVQSNAHPAPAPAAVEAVYTSEGNYYAWMPVPVTSFGAAVLGSSLCVAGGYHGKPHAYSREGQSDRFECYDFGEARWETGAPLPYGVQGVVLVPHEDALYRVGGMRAANDPGDDMSLHSTRDFARYDPRSKTWVELTPLPEARSSHAACASGNELFVTGGWKLSGSPKDAVWATTTWVVDLSSDPIEWKPVETPFRARAGGIACTEGQVTYIGGLGPDRAKLLDTYTLDAATRTWRPGPEYPGDGFGVAAVGFGDAVVASGADGTVYRLERSSGEWSDVSTLLFPRFFHQLAVTSDGRILAVGGIQSMRSGKRIAHVEQLPVDGSPHLTLLELRNESRAKNRQGGVLAGDTLYLVGGNNSVGQHDFEPENFLDDAYALDLASLSWSALPPFPKKRQTMSAHARGDDGFVLVGGFGNEGEKPQTFHQAYAFDRDDRAWSEDAAALPRGRSQFGLAQHEGALWVFGGLNYDPDRGGSQAFDHRVDVLVARPGEPFEDSGVRLPSARRAFGGAVLDGRYYMVGGMKESFQLVEDCAVFEFATRELSSMPCPSETRLSPELVVVNGRLFLVGGSTLVDGKAVPSKSIEVYDPSSARWSVWMDDMPIPGNHVRAFAYRNRLLLYSANDPERPIVRIAFVNVE